MKKKILVIELLNIVYENQNVPDKVQYKDTIYLYDELYQDYRLFNKKTKEFRNMFEFIKDNHSYWLYEVVEILEDEEEIDIQNIEELQTFSDSTVYDYNDIDRNRKVLNMLVKAVKKLDKNKVDYIQPYKED